MRRLALFFSFSIICTVFLYGQLITRGDAAAQINIQYKKHSHNHYEFPVPADQPDVYYDSNAQSII